MDDLRLVTELYEAGNGWPDVMPRKEAYELVAGVIGRLDRGELRVATLVDGEVIVNEAAKHSILMWFRVNDMKTLEAGPFEYVDKLPLKQGFEKAGVRVVPGGSARFGAYLAPGVVLMPSYVNIGAYVDRGTMVDTWATVASCAQIGENVHLSGGVGIGGVLEPPQAKPVVVEDDCFIGSRCMIVNGARVRGGREGRCGRDPHRHDTGDRGRYGPRGRTGCDSRTGDRGAGHAYEGIRGRQLRVAVRLDPAVPRRRRGTRQLQLNAILREHGVVS